MDSQARTDLAENILRKIDSSKSWDEIKRDRNFARLMKLLDGSPLAMKVVLVNLKRKSPEEILEQFEKAEIDPGGDGKEDNIYKCIEYSYNNLSESAQKLLLLLAPFRGFINIYPILHYIEELEKFELFQDYELEQLEATVAEAVKWGLLSTIKDYPHLFTIQPVLPYFLQTKRKEVDEETRKALQEGFKNHYQWLASSYNDFLKSKKPQEKQKGIAFVHWEYENLYQALQICLEKKESVNDIWRCLYIYLGVISNKKEQLQLTKNLYDKLSQDSFKNSYQVWEKDIGSILSNLANCYLDNQDYQKAKEILELKLENIEDSQQSSLAITYHQSGRVQEELKQYEQARKYYQKALNIKTECDDSFYPAATYHQLGRAAQELREYEQAREYYLQALDFFIRNDDRFSQAGSYHQLGRVAQELREYEQAQECYLQAIAIYDQYKDRFSQAVVYHQLGVVFQELGEYEQARNCYLQALEIYINYGDHYEQAKTYHQLGRIDEQFRQFQQAREYYQQAIDIYDQYDDRYEQAETYHQLGYVARELREYQQAREYYKKALDIFIEYKDRYKQAPPYLSLGVLAKKLSKFEEAKSYYFKALRIFIDFGDQQNRDLVIRNLARLSQKTQDNSLLRKVVVRFNIPEAKVRELFESVKG